jgi:hypothetical protein
MDARTTEAPFRGPKSKLKRLTAALERVGSVESVPEK